MAEMKASKDANGNSYVLYFLSIIVTSHQNEMCNRTLRDRRRSYGDVVIGGEGRHLSISKPI
jgi:hypothetical protein